VAKERLKGARVVKDRVKRLGLKGKAANRVLRTGLIPAAVYGAKVTGMTNGQIEALTSVAHQTLGKASGRSAYARLTLSGGLPAAGPAIAPIWEWALAVFDRRVPAGILEAAWRSAVAPVGLAKDPSAAGKGPAGAAVAAAARIGWKMPSWDSFVEPTGFCLRLKDEAPQTVKKAALEGFDDWSAERSLLAAQLGAAPWLEPLSAFLASKKPSAAVKGSLRAMAEGGWPTQASLHQDGLADSPLCRACGLHNGTLYHRVRVCQHQAWMRKGKQAARAGLIGGSPGDLEEEASPLLRRGIPIAPERLPPPPVLGGTCRRARGPG